MTSTTPAPARVRTIPITALLGLGLVAAGSTIAAPATAAPAPITLEGRGYGHGRGMSQWGSYQQAVEGRTWPQILSFYYPGATVAPGRATSIRVSTVSRTGSTVRVAAEEGLVATDGAGQRVVLATRDGSTPVTSWEVGRPSIGGTATSTTLWFHTAAGRKALRTTNSGRWTITATDGSLTALNARGSVAATYLGALTGHRSGTTIVPVLRTSLEDYTRQVVPWENYTDWPVQAQAAQAVAARSYGAWYVAHPRHRLYDICDTTSCQVFGGIAKESTQTRDGVAATAGRVLTVGGAVVRSEFSASNGGQVAPGGYWWTALRPDPYEDRLPVTVTRWTATVDATSLQRRHPSLGTVRRVVVTSRDGHGQWGGRVRTVRVEGSTGRVTLTASQFAPHVKGWKGAWFTVA